MIDIHSGSKDPRAARLSNFTDRPFILDDVRCAGVEGILQAIKQVIVAHQVHICGLTGKEAKLFDEQGHHLWKPHQELYWRGEIYPRHSLKYQNFITRIYNTVYEQDPTFKEDLLAVGNEDICHSIGNPDPRDTVLTEVELIYQLNRLRIRAMRESI